MNIFELAIGNDTKIKEEFDVAKEKLSGAETSCLAKFADHVKQNGHISINIQPWVLNDFLTNGTHQNIYEWASEQSAISGRPEDEILHEKLGTYYDRRLAFDDSFDNGRQFRYGTLNIGSMGPEKYGIFCAALKDKSSRQVAFLKEDSLNSYMNMAENLKETDIASPHSSHHLAALKHINEIAPTDERDWPNLVSSDKDYIEAIFLDNLNTGDLDEVRITHKEYNGLRDLAFADFAKKRDAGERALIQDFVGILKAQNDGIINLEKV